MSWLRLMEEKIKENESGSTEELESAKQPVLKKKHSVGDLVREMWPAYLIEIFVIILGISITLALEEWRDKGKENQLENIYLQNLLSDVETDSIALKNAIGGTERLLGNGNQLLNYIRASDSGNISFNQINKDVQAILGRPNFISSDATFSDLKSSGKLHLIKDIGLKNSLFAYYGETQLIKEVQIAEQQATIILSGSYFLKSFPIDSVEHPALPAQIAGTSLLSDIQFENNVLLRVRNREELLSIYQRADSIGGALRETLSNKIHY